MTINEQNIKALTRTVTLSKTKIDLYESLTDAEYEQVSNIFLAALTREKGLKADVFEIDTNIYSDNFINS